MTTTKIFKNGQSQAVRLLKEFRMLGDIVKISHVKEGVLLEPIPEDFNDLFLSLDQFSDDVMTDGRSQPKQQERENLF